MSGARRGVLLAAALLAPAAGAAGDLGDGRALYHGHRPFAAGREATANRLPPRFAACSSCHGPLAEGRREGAAAAPPVTWAELMRPRAGEPAYASPGEVLRAMTEGAGRGGRSLAPAMPRFRLDAAEAGALIDYLHIAGTLADNPPGVGAATVEFGTVLPLTGPAAATGQAVLQGLREVFDGPAARGGINGRRIVLTAVDGAGAGAAEAVRTLLAKPVYAMVAGLWARGDPLDAQLADARVPHVGALVVRATSAEAGAWAADLLPPLDLQQDALAGALGRCPVHGLRMALQISAKSTPEGIAHPTADDSGVRWFADAGALAAALRDGGPTGCVGLGLQGMAALGGAVPAGWQGLVVLPFPVALLEPGAGDGRGGPWHRLGLAAGRLAVEWLARSGAVLHERSLLDQLPGTDGFEVLPGAPVRFGPRRRHGWDAAEVHLAVTPAPPGGTGTIAGTIAGTTEGGPRP